MAGQPPRIGPNPPIIHYPDLTKSLTADEAQSLLSTYLDTSRKAPYLHPDAWLFSDGVKYGPKAGPSGGWALHHLRRIEAGLRGEQLEAESKEDLIAKFGEDAVPDSAHIIFAPAKDGDDTHVDQVIEDSQAAQEVTDKQKRKDKKRERKEKEIAAKRIKLDDSDAAMSGANTPYQDSMVGYGDKWQAKNGDEDEWQDKAEYEQQQQVLEGEVADRDPSNGRQVTSPPVVVKHNVDGQVIVPKGHRTAEEKAARKAAKKARRKEQMAGNEG